MTIKPYKLTPIVPKEAQVQNAVMRYLSADRRFGLVLRINNGAAKVTDKNGQRYIPFVRGVDGKSVKGVCDVMTTVRETGQLVWIECKAPGKKASKEQLEFMRRAEEGGAFTAVVTSLDDLIAALAAF